LNISGAIDYGQSARVERQENSTVRPLASGVQGLQISDTLDRQIPVLFDEIALHAAGIGRSENFGPVETIFSYSHIRNTAS
jgi:hypothetical protein